MNAQQIRQAYLDFFEKRGHVVIPRARIVPENDPTTLFTGSGMQPLIPYLLGQKHQSGTRLTDSQTCFRAEDIDEVGDVLPEELLKRQQDGRLVADFFASVRERAARPPAEHDSPPATQLQDA